MDGSENECVYSKPTSRINCPAHIVSDFNSSFPEDREKMIVIDLPQH